MPRLSKTFPRTCCFRVASALCDLRLLECTRGAEGRGPLPSITRGNQNSIAIAITEQTIETITFLTLLAVEAWLCVFRAAHDAIYSAWHLPNFQGSLPFRVARVEDIRILPRTLGTMHKVRNSVHDLVTKQVEVVSCLSLSSFVGKQGISHLQHSSS